MDDRQCKNCAKMRKKILIYDKFFQEMKKLEDETVDHLEESIIIQRNDQGITHKTIHSNLTESFLIIDKGKDLRHLNLKEQAVINEQTNLHHYNQIKDKVGVASTVIGYVVSVGKWFALL